MPVVGFRAGISGFGGSGWQPVGQAPNYYKVYFTYAYEDDLGRYDNANAVWRPVLAGETARRVMMGSQITILGGAKYGPATNAIFGVKIQKNASVDIASGQGIADFSKPGFANMQVTTTALAQPGDFFNVIVLASCWAPGNPPIVFTSPWAPGSLSYLGGDGNYCAIDNNQFHTYFWGTDTMP